MAEGWQVWVFRRIGRPSCTFNPCNILLSLHIHILSFFWLSSIGCCWPTLWGLYLLPCSSKCLLSIFFKALCLHLTITCNCFSKKVHGKLIKCFLDTGEVGNILACSWLLFRVFIYVLFQAHKIVAYADKVGYRPDYASILALLLKTNPPQAAYITQALLEKQPPVVPIEAVCYWSKFCFSHTATLQGLNAFTFWNIIDHWHVRAGTAYARDGELISRNSKTKQVRYVWRHFLFTSFFTHWIVLQGEKTLGCTFYHNLHCSVYCFDFLGLWIQQNTAWLRPDFWNSCWLVARHTLLV